MKRINQAIINRVANQPSPQRICHRFKYAFISALFVLAGHLSAGVYAADSGAQTDVDPTSQSNTEPASETIEMTPAMQAAAAAHQECVNAIMATLTKAQVKREQIQEQCADAEATLLQTFPEEIQQLVAVNTHRQIEAVLLSLEQIEETVVESSEDAAEIANELAELEAQQQAQALQEAETQAAAEAEARLSEAPPASPEEPVDGQSSDDGG